MPGSIGVEPLMAESMCELASRQRHDLTSLGVFKPKDVEDLVITGVDVNADKQAIARAWAAQGNLLEGLSTSEKSHQLREIEQVPYRFKYCYRCDDAKCNGHEPSRKGHRD